MRACELMSKAYDSKYPSLGRPLAIRDNAQHLGSNLLCFHDVSISYWLFHPTTVVCFAYCVFRNYVCSISTRGIYLCDRMLRAAACRGHRTTPFFLLFVPRALLGIIVARQGNISQVWECRVSPWVCRVWRLLYIADIARGRGHPGWFFWGIFPRRWRA